MKRATLYIVILGITCIGLGTALGVTLERNYTQRNFPRIARSHFLGHRSGTGHFMHREGYRREGLKAGGAAGVCEHIGRKLDLTSEQSEKVEAILEDSKQQVTQASNAFKTELKSIKEKSDARILELLNPEQKEKFQEMNSMMGQRKEGMGRSFRKMMK